MGADPELQLRAAQMIAYVAARIRQLRLKRGLTVQQFADRCEMERSNMSRIEAGRTNMTLRTLCLIGATLKVEVCDLFPGSACDSLPRNYPGVRAAEQHNNVK